MNNNIYKLMRTRKLHLFILVTFVLFVTACNSNTGNQAAAGNDSAAVKPETKVLSEKEKEVIRLNDIAKFVAGMPLDKSSELYELTETPEWTNYSEEAKTAWDKFNEVAAKYSAFQKSEIQPPYNTIKTLFYPFSGPDFLFANVMFPNVHDMILIGLEGPGSIPVIDSTVKDSLKTTLELYKVAIEDVIQLSFFRTIDMKNELGNKTIDGTTPIIMLFLVRSGKELVEVTPKVLNNDGELVNVNELPKKKKPMAVEIKYRNPGEKQVRKVVYLSTNLADPSLSNDKAFMNFLRGLDNQMATFVKSATYLMHKSYFSIIRNTCLEKSLFILQDDSGIAYKFFDKDKWNITLYGTYSKPVPLFKDFFEQDYFDAFKKGSPKKLDFRIGYSQKSNLLVATKK